MKRYKFQALVTLTGQENAGPGVHLGPEPHRMVVRGRDEETRRSQFFSALISCDDDGPFRLGDRGVLVTLRSAGDDVTDHLGIGRHFGLWLGRDVGEVVITRLLFV